MFSLQETLIRPLTEFIFPPLCISCHRLRPDASSGSRICAECWEAIKPVRTDDMLYQETRSKLLTTGMVDEMVAVFEFDETGSLPSIIHQLKYGGMSTLGVELGRCLGKRLQDSIDDPTSFLLIPVPLHMVKLRERGYNQSDILCKGVAEITHIPAVDALKRTRYTRSQTKLSREERKKNVVDAFEVRKDDFLDKKTVILVDDVITTGATTAECARALRNRGAEKILATAVALAP